MEEENINIRSAEVNDILGKPPAAIIRYGITVIFAIISVVFAFSFIFRYPDIIVGSFFIQTSNPPAFLLSNTTSKIQSLLIENGDSVYNGQLLAIIGNSTDFENYKKLKQLIEIHPQPLQVYNVWDSIGGNSGKLGELQAGFAAYLKSVDDYSSF